MMIGCDLEGIDEFTLSLLTNDEVLEINQDSLGAAAAPIDRDDSIRVWARHFGVDSLMSVTTTGSARSRSIARSAENRRTPSAAAWRSCRFSPSQATTMSGTAAAPSTIRFSRRICRRSSDGSSTRRRSTSRRGRTHGSSPTSCSPTPRGFSRRWTRPRAAATRSSSATVRSRRPTTGVSSGFCSAEGGHRAPSALPRAHPQAARHRAVRAPPLHRA